jgi:hypothetical protein
MKYSRIIVVLALAIFLAGLAARDGARLRPRIPLQPDPEPAHQGLKEAYGLIHRQQVDEAHRLLHRLAPNDAVGQCSLGLLQVQKGDMGFTQEEYNILQSLAPALA